MIFVQFCEFLKVTVPQCGLVPHFVEQSGEVVLMRVGQMNMFVSFWEALAKLINKNPDPHQQNNKHTPLQRRHNFSTTRLMLLIVFHLRQVMSSGSQTGDTELCISFQTQNCFSKPVVQGPQGHKHWQGLKIWVEIRMAKFREYFYSHRKNKYVWELTRINGQSTQSKVVSSHITNWFNGYSFKQLMAFKRTVSKKFSGPGLSSKVCFYDWIKD